MGIEAARSHLRKFGRDSDIMEFEVSSATVELAAQALGTEQARIAKTLSFKLGESAFLVVTAGNMKIDNRKFKDEFGVKAAMLDHEEVKTLIGHEVGGVCPFGVKDGIAIYLDISMKRYDHIFPAAGSANSAIRLNCDELEQLSGAKKWVDVCKEKEPRGP